MLVYVVKPVLEVMHLLHTASAFILTTSYYIGRTILLVLLKACHIIKDTFSALAIIGEELYHFVCELNTSIGAVTHYVRTSANGGVNCVIEAVVVFCHHMCNFLTNTRLHSKLLATNLGCFLCGFFELIRKALLLIADCAWWLIMLIPRSLGYAIITVGDLVVNCITTVRKAVVYTITVVVEDIFRLTIAVVLLFLLWHNRRRLLLFTLRCIAFVKKLLLICYRRLLLLRSQLFGRRPNASVVQRITPTRTRLPRSSVSPAASDKSIDHQQRCVVCRDRQKCVLLLPCKHLCLCEECADYMTFSAQRQMCPLCRTNINHSMSVYT